MAGIKDLVDEVRLHAPGAPNPLLVEKYRDAAREFFRRTLTWRGAPSAITVGASFERYVLTPPADAEAFDATYVQIDTAAPLTKATEEQILMANPRRKTGTPRYFRVVGNTLHIDPSPESDVSSAMTAISVLRPTRTATTLPDDVVDRFGHYIQDGAIGRLLLMPQKPWTNNDKGSHHLNRFADHVDEWWALGGDGGMVGVPRAVAYGGL